VDHLSKQSATTNEAVTKHENTERTTRPDIPGKPEYLSSKASASQPDVGNGSATARLQRLSMNKNASRPFSTPSNGLPASLVAGGPATTRPSLKPSNGLPTSLVAGVTASARPPLKPQGPREMVPALDMRAALPQMPAPIYSPSTSYGSPRGLSPPRSSARTSVNSAKQNEVRGASFPGPTQRTLTVEMLGSYLKTASVLLLDVRSRDEYEEGHIYSRYIVCIEPIILREG
jgi:ubiquitin carboxyl-terminal hydrolase 8